MSHAILGTPAAEVRKLQSLVDDGRRLRAQLRRVARALDRADPRERTAARAGLDTIARRGRGWSRENRALLVSLVIHYYPPDRLAGLPRLPQLRLELPPLLHLGVQLRRRRRLRLLEPRVRRALRLGQRVGVAAPLDTPLLLEAQLRCLVGWLER